MSKTLIGTLDIKDWKTLSQQLFAEFVGTFIYLSISIVAANDNIGYTVVGDALANGLLIASVIQITGRVSGGYINPAVTLGVLIYGYMSIWKAVLYIAAQILGSIVGTCITYALAEDLVSANFGATVPYKSLNAGQVFGLECIMTFTLVAVVLSIHFQKCETKGIVIGLCVTACQCASLGYTASLNPVKSLGPAIVMNIWKHHAMYWLGPLSGGLAAGLVFRFVFPSFKNASGGENV